MPEKDTCFYCGHNQAEKLYAVKDIFADTYHLAECDRCKAKYLYPHPSEKQLSRAYDESYYGEKEEKFSFPIIEKVLDFFRGGRARKLARLLKKTGRVLDIGCGNGRFLSYLNSKGNFEIFGTELSGGAAERAKRVNDLNLRIGRVEEAGFQENSFDAISLFHVFEHLQTPADTLDEIDKILKDGGYLLMSFPNIGSMQSRMFKDKWLHIDTPRHLFFFETNDFEQIMKKRGYRIINKKFASIEQNPFGMVQSLLNMMFKTRDILFERLKGNKAYAPGCKGFCTFIQYAFFIFTFPCFVFSDWIVSAFGDGATVEYILIKEIPANKAE